MTRMGHAVVPAIKNPRKPRTSHVLGFRLVGAADFLGAVYSHRELSPTRPRIEGGALNSPRVTPPKIWSWAVCLVIARVL